MDTVAPRLVTLGRAEVGVIAGGTQRTQCSATAVREGSLEEEISTHRGCGQ